LNNNNNNNNNNNHHHHHNNNNNNNNNNSINVHLSNHLLATKAKYVHLQRLQLGLLITGRTMATIKHDSKKQFKF
jgi:hypothetical protein